MKRILVLSDSFKGTLSSKEIGSLFLKEGESYSNLGIITYPIADGGEGSLEAISERIEGNFIHVHAHDMHGNEGQYPIYLSNKTAYIETAITDGLGKIKGDNNPGYATTYGIGEQIKEAIALGAKTIYVFLGGSASNDGGCGMASVLGVLFFDMEGKEFIPVGYTLKNIHHFDDRAAKTLLNGIKIIGLVDVKNPLCGSNGATYIYAKQKGAKEEELPLLEANMTHLASLLGDRVASCSGSGAAGGLGAGLKAFASASLSSGIETMLDLMRVDEIIQEVDYVITGEGKFDGQSFSGKVVDGIAKRAGKQHKPLLLFVGQSDLSYTEASSLFPGLKGIYETNPSHLPFEQIRQTAKSDAILSIRKLLSDLDQGVI